MGKPFKLVLLGVAVLGVLTALAIYLHGTTVAVLQPAGTVAVQERNLIIFGSLLSLVIVVPVFGLTAAIAWRYREGNTEASYEPDFDHSRLLETIWWLVPGLLILILSVVAWQSSHSLDPSRPLVSSTPPITIQVVAMDWKWLFIYPDEHFATVNYLQIPQNTPINFEITSDAPMNSFWIPQLGGQMYAMTGMSMPLHLMATKTGTFRGLSANISGQGFAGMNFTVQSASQTDFQQWSQAAQTHGGVLNEETYAQLATPSQNNPPTTYGSVSEGLYDTVVNKYMGSTHSLSGATTGMSMQ